jgi:hypothetical protein
MFSQSEINSRMLPWGDREFSRFAFRVALFRRRFMSETEATKIADRLALMDQERDDRRMCVECENLQQDGGCFAAAQGWIAQTTKTHKPVRTLQQRCEAFKFCKP